jgi:hypothetical protein
LEIRVQIKTELLNEDYRRIINKEESTLSLNTVVPRFWIILFIFNSMQNSVEFSSMRDSNSKIKEGLNVGFYVGNINNHGKALCFIKDSYQAKLE